MALFVFVYATFTLYGHLFHSVLLTKKVQYWSPTTPDKIWFGLFPVRSSLTKGISFDLFSSGYLDISVPQLTFLCTRQRTSCITTTEVTLFGHRRITAFWELLDDFRALDVLLRPNKPRHPLSALIHIILRLRINDEIDTNVSFFF